MLRALAIALLALVAAPAHAEPPHWSLPATDVGFVAVGGGVRYVPQGDFLAAMTKLGNAATARSAVKPNAQLALLYRVDRKWTVEADGAWSQDAYAFKDGASLDFQTIVLSLGGTRAFNVSLGWLEPFAGGGAGYYFSSLTAKDKAGKTQEVETPTTGFYLSAGLRAALTDQFGLVLEDRYSFAVAPLGEQLGLISVGGNSVNLMFYGLWRN